MYFDRPLSSASLSLLTQGSGELAYILVHIYNALNAKSIVQNSVFGLRIILGLRREGAAMG
jgi:hypothetical protein